jgi:hypothetical protein
MRRRATCRRQIVDTLGSAKILRPGRDATIAALAPMQPRALAAAEKLAQQGMITDDACAAGAARHPDHFGSVVVPIACLRSRRNHVQ